MDAIKLVADMVKRAEQHASDQSKDRLRAIEYYNGTMEDTPADTGKSQQVSRDVRANIKKVLPSLMRTLLGSDEVVEFMPVGEGDEDGADQSSDYMNYIVLPESDAQDAIYDALHDALLMRNGILKWWHEDKKSVKISKHSGLNEDALAQLVSEDGVEVVEHDERVDQVEYEGRIIDVPVHDVKIRRTLTESRDRCAAVPRERFLIHPDAVTLEDSLLTGEKTTVSRSDLVSMGYDRKMIDELPIGERDDEERAERRGDFSDADEAERANEPLDFYDIYVRVDMDGDGIAELRHMTFAGGLTEANLLEDDECDEVQFCDVCVMRQPHQWEGISLADDLMDLQRVKTVLVRQTLDNIYWQNNLQPMMQDGAIIDEDAVYNPSFGKPITVKKGVDVRAAIGYNQVPFVAAQSFAMLDYMDAEAQDRTGVSDASAGLAPDALQNMTAKASAMIEQAAIGQTELMVKTAAEGLRRFFRGMLRLHVRHQDMPRTVRLRNEWVQVDPRHWNADMDCSVNTGLGAGTRERDMQMMQVVMGLQEKLLGAFGSDDNPFVTPENLYASISRLADSAGLKTTSLYFTEPDPEKIKALIEQKNSQPPPEKLKLDAEMQLEQMKMQSNAAKEKAQMDADLTVKQAEIQANSLSQSEKLQSEAALQQKQHEFEMAKFRMQMAHDTALANQARTDEIMKAQAAAYEAAQ